jgi:hypothetical protein
LTAFSSRRSRRPSFAPARGSGDNPQSLTAGRGAPRRDFVERAKTALTKAPAGIEGTHIDTRRAHRLFGLIIQYSVSQG